MCISAFAGLLYLLCVARSGANPVHRASQTLRLAGDTADPHLPPHSLGRRRLQTAQKLTILGAGCGCAPPF